MDRKWIAVAVLAAITLTLAVILGQVMHSPRMVYAQGGRYADYVVGTANLSSAVQAFVVIDTAQRRMIFYEYDISTKKLKPISGDDLVREFNRKTREGRE